MIIRTSSGHLFRVRPADGIDHAWHGIPVKRTASGFAAKSGAVERLVRKAGCYEVDREEAAAAPAPATALSDSRIEALAGSAQHGFANWAVMWDELRSMAAEIRRYRNGGAI
jgi:hypothetical protein